MPITCQESTIIEYDRNSQKAMFKHESTVILDGESEKNYSNVLCFKEVCKGFGILVICLGIKNLFFPEKKALAQ